MDRQAQPTGWMAESVDWMPPPFGCAARPTGSTTKSGWFSTKPMVFRIRAAVKGRRGKVRLIRKPGIHIQIAEKLGRQSREVSAAINLLIESGRRNDQVDGIVYDSTGKVIAKDPERAFKS